MESRREKWAWRLLLIGVVVFFVVLVQGQVAQQERNVRAYYELQRATCPLKALAGAITDEARIAQEQRVQGLMLDGAESDPSVIVDLILRATYRLADYPDAIDPTVRFALQTKIAIGCQPEPMIDAIAAVVVAYPDRANDIPAVGNMIVKAWILSMSPMKGELKPVGDGG